MAERIHAALGALAVAILAGGVIAWRAIGTPSRPLPPVPSPRLGEVMAYAKPLPDSLRVSELAGVAIGVARDPFSPREIPAAPPRLVASQAAPTPHAAAAPRWDVTAILIAGARRAALINGVLVNIGDAAPGGATLTAVERDRVVLTDPNGTAHTVAVKEGDS